MKINQKTIIDAAGHLEQTLVRKNLDYGSSVEKQYQKYGNTSLLIRLEDKFRRLEEITERDTYVDETMADTLLDLAGYALLGYILHRYEDEENDNPYSIENDILNEENDRLKKEIKRLTTELTQLNFRKISNPAVIGPYEVGQFPKTHCSDCAKTFGIAEQRYATLDKKVLCIPCYEKSQKQPKYSDQDDQY
jgi:hypothetical protein